MLISGTCFSEYVSDISDPNIKLELHINSDDSKYIFICRYQNTRQESIVKLTSVSPSELRKSSALRTQHYIHKKRKLRKDLLPEMLPAGLWIEPSEGKELSGFIKGEKF
jgi:hypothetical protein